MSEPFDNSTPPRTRKKLTPEEQRTRKQATFLKAFRLSGNIKHSCKVAGIDRQTYYNWRDKDEAFQAQLPDANADADDTLEMAAYDRAVSGIPSYVVSQGHMVYEEIPMFNEDGSPKLDPVTGKHVWLRGKPLVEYKYSDSLLTTLLKARMPEKYKERVSNEHSGSMTVKADYSKYSDEELAVLEQLARKGQA